MKGYLSALEFIFKEMLDPEVPLPLIRAIRMSANIALSAHCAGEPQHC
jgi:hypothetical protein